MKIKYNTKKAIRPLTLIASIALSSSLYAGDGFWGDNSFGNNSKQSSTYKQNSKNKYSHSKNSKNNKGPWKKNVKKKFNKKSFKKKNKHIKPNNDSIPLDGGLSILLLGAAAFGVKKLRNNSND